MSRHSVHAFLLLAALSPVTGCFRLSPVHPLPPGVSAEFGPAFDVMAEVARFAPGELWPDFTPARVPLAIYDGHHTLLFGHPHIPTGFAPVAGAPRVLRYPGRHPLVRANSSVMLEDVPTATVLLDVSRMRELKAWAGLAVHEAFHIYQWHHYPGWAPNEADQFVYPVDDIGNLRERRIETDALRMALAARRDSVAACWTARALTARRRRFARLDPAAVDYERKTELLEGLADYVESRARRAGVTIPAGDFPPEAVRARGYSIGAAFAALLDRLAPGWARELERPPPFLDQLLAAATAFAGDCELPAPALAYIRLQSERDVIALRERREGIRADFLRRPGWRVIVESHTDPLLARRFDPLDVVRLSPREVLHRRTVTLTNAAGMVDLLGLAGLTEAAGDHPLFAGVRRLTITGLAAEPRVEITADGVRIDEPGLVLRFAGASVEREEGAVRVVVW